MKVRLAAAVSGAVCAVAAAGLAIAQGTWVTVGVADVQICRPVFAEVHRLEQEFLLDQIDASCARGTSTYNAEVCSAARDLLEATREVDDVDWFMSGNDICDDGSPYPCYGAAFFNTPRTGREAQRVEAAIRDRAELPARIQAGMDFMTAAPIGDRCLAQAWVAKADGAPAAGGKPPKSGGPMASSKSQRGGQLASDPAPVDPATPAPPRASAPAPEPAPAPTAPRATPSSPRAGVIPFAPDAPRGQQAPLVGAQLTECDDAMRTAQTDSQTWKGTPEEKALRLGQIQRTLFNGRCAGHAQAAALVADAERSIAISAASAASAYTSPSETSPDAIDCVVPMIPNDPRNTTGSTALRNSCAYPVTVAYCNVAPLRGSWAEMFKCGVKGSLAMDVIPANSATPAVFGKEVQHFACRAPAGPVLTFDTAKGLDGFCK